MGASTLETWLAGPMGFVWEDLTPEECDKKMDELLLAHSIKWHAANKSTRKDK